jgi:hypothetical protein
MDKETKRICNLCYAEKSIEEFHRDHTAPNGYKRRCKNCIKGDYSKAEVSSVRAKNAIPSIGITSNCPCSGCEYEKPCGILELTCKQYRRWQTAASHSTGYLKHPRIPDLHLDGSIPAHGVV